MPRVTGAQFHEASGDDMTTNSKIEIQWKEGIKNICIKSGKSASEIRKRLFTRMVYVLCFLTISVCFIEFIRYNVDAEYMPSHEPIPLHIAFSIQCSLFLLVVIPKFLFDLFGIIEIQISKCDVDLFYKLFNYSFFHAKRPKEKCLMVVVYPILERRSFLERISSVKPVIFENPCLSIFCLLDRDLAIRTRNLAVSDLDFLASILSEELNVSIDYKKNFSR